MRLMTPTSTYTEYSKILRTLRRRGERLDFFLMGAAADLAVALSEPEPDEAEIQKLRERLGLEDTG